MKPSHRDHKDQAPRSVSVALVTISDTRDEAADTSGRLIKDMLKEAGHGVNQTHIVPDDPSRISRLLEELLASSSLQAVILNGGTGISHRDVTFDVINGILEKPLPGFGELFRALSYQEIGSAAMLSRATAGVRGGKVLFSIPGSRGAVRLAMEKLILPELGHIVYELNKQKAEVKAE
ncbi:MAG: MogA/MoaB family molybdenum cofactor biosynthesis protein [Deltaproteobacteria bacterium]|nr:MogA/MoaB family molybdenum cofactor biosynthesis protein [Deltaproteobacteria bacterium]